MSKFCGNCGSELPDSADFCGKCGMTVQSAEHSDANNLVPKKKRKPIIIVACAIVVIIGIILINVIPKTYDEPCVWCNDKPTYAYTLSNGEVAYVCDECSSECMICGEKATKYYTSLAELPVFVCDECYNESVE